MARQAAHEGGETNHLIRHYDEDDLEEVQIKIGGRDREESSPP